MKEPSAIHSTFVIERNYGAAPEKVFAAFADPAIKRRWFVERRGNQIDTYHMDFRTGGQEAARFRFNSGSPVAGLTCENDATFLNIVPGRRIVLAQSMTIGGRCISAALITVDLLPDDAGTVLILTHQGAFFEGADGPEMRHEGWRNLMDALNTELAG